MAAYDGGLTLLLKLVGISTITFTTHMVMSALFGLNEMKPVIAWLRRIVLRPIKVEY